jgi:hypothetical protein
VPYSLNISCTGRQSDSYQGRGERNLSWSNCLSDYPQNFPRESRNIGRNMSRQRDPQFSTHDYTSVYLMLWKPRNGYDTVKLSINHNKTSWHNWFCIFSGFISWKKSWFTADMERITFYTVYEKLLFKSLHSVALRFRASFLLFFYMGCVQIVIVNSNYIRTEWRNDEHNDNGSSHWKTSYHIRLHPGPRAKFSNFPKKWNMYLCVLSELAHWENSLKCNYLCS